ncbi:hypothetical protein AB0M10_33930 [Streptomyces sp. NPDC051840]|uniref:hypothetical protein n=1 Tax=Streptomyces sp. NPDC051840 TaxID=3154752 RepID=UPI00341AC2EB
MKSPLERLSSSLINMNHTLETAVSICGAVAVEGLSVEDATEAAREHAQDNVTPLPGLSAEDREAWERADSLRIEAAADMARRAIDAEGARVAVQVLDAAWKAVAEHDDKVRALVDAERDRALLAAGGLD